MPSFVHISDVQDLSEYVPNNLFSLFTAIETLKEEKDIVAIFHTGDILNYYESDWAWRNYATAKTLTTIPVYDIAGNHDNSYHGLSEIYDWRYYDYYIGENKHNWFEELDDFIFIGISSLHNDAILDQETLNYLNSAIISNPLKIPIICTHKYMIVGGEEYRPIGIQIQENLIHGPTIILCGDLIDDRTQLRRYSEHNVVESILNYQFRWSLPESDSNIFGIAVFRLYTYDYYPYTREIKTISVETYFVYPEQPVTDSINVYLLDESVKTRKLISPDIPKPESISDINFYRNYRLRQWKGV